MNLSDAATPQERTLRLGMMRGSGGIHGGAAGIFLLLVVV